MQKLKESRSERDDFVRKRHSILSELALLQTLSRLFHLVQLVKYYFFCSWILNCMEVQEKKANSCLVFTSSAQKWNKALSRRSRTVTAKCDVRAKLLFC